MIKLTRQSNTATASWLVTLTAAFMALTGCSGGGSGGNTTAASGACSTANCGTLMVGLTDADGDFVNYWVDVLSLTLKRSDGSTVEMLPKTTRVDFAQLTNLSDLLSVATLAPGDIVGGTIRLDYTNAEINVEAGGQVVQADVVDGNNNPIGVTSLDIQLSDRDHLVITRGRAAFLSLDFDLAASNQVNTDVSPPKVTAQPYLVADVQPVANKQFRVRGALSSVDASGDSYTVDVRPSHDHDADDFGSATVHTTDATSYEIDGTAYTGSAGLDALAQLDTGTMTVALGNLDLQTHDFTADTVLAGTSVSGEGLDAIHGNVVSRNGDQLTVKGGFEIGRDHHLHFRRTVVVTVGPDTNVLKAGSTDTLDIGAISVGQNIVAFGTYTDAVSDSTPATLDATAGRVRLNPTRLRGDVTLAQAGELDLQLRSIDRLGPDLFDFTGTGGSGQDADPGNYQISTGTLSLTGVSAGQTAEVIGFVTPFGSAPPDFEGNTVVNQLNLVMPALLGIGWGDTGTTAPFVTMNSDGLVLDVSNPNIGERHYLFAGWQLIDLTTLTATPPTIAPADTRTMFGIWEPGHAEQFSNFGDFVAALTSRLGAGQPALSLQAEGSYDQAAAKFSANRVVVQFASP